MVPLNTTPRVFSIRTFLRLDMPHGQDVERVREGRVACETKREPGAFFVPQFPEQFQAARRVIVEVAFLGVMAGKGIARAAIAPTNAAKMANSTFWLV